MAPVEAAPELHRSVAEAIAREAMRIAASIDIYTNESVVVESLESV